MAIPYIQKSGKLIPRCGYSTDKPASPASISEYWVDTDTDSIWKVKLVAGLGLVWVDVSSVSSDDDQIIVNFTYASTFPLIIHLFTGSWTITKCRLDILTAFDGTGGFHVGYSGFTSRIMEITDSDMFSEGSYQVDENLLLPVSTDIQIYSTVSGASVGDGSVILNITR